MVVNKLLWSLHLPRATYKEGINYYGTFPEGFINKINSLEIVRSPSVNLCSGVSNFCDVRVDVKENKNVNLITDARNTGLPDNYANFVMLDPYYSKEDFKKVNLPYVSIYEFLKEAYRITKIGGYICVLHNRPPRKPKGTDLTHLIAISMGPDRLLRCCLIFKKVE